MSIDVTDILTDLIARNRGPDPLNPDTPCKPDYGIEASLEGNVLSVVLTFRRGSAYCCMEHGCHLALTDGRRWSDLRARLASRQIAVSARLELRLSGVIEEGALFFNWARPVRTRPHWYSFEPVAAYRYDISARESEMSNTNVDLWVYYPRPADQERERRIRDIAIRHGGRPTDWRRELPDGHQAGDPPYPIYTIIEFSDLDAAKQARQELLVRGDAVSISIMPGPPN